MKSETLTHSEQQFDLITGQGLEPWLSVDALLDELNKGANQKTWTNWGLRHYIQNAKDNGLAPYISRLGSKILISKPGFYKWIADNRKLSNNPK